MLEISNIEICDNDVIAALKRVQDAEGNTLFKYVTLSSRTDARMPTKEECPAVLVERTATTVRTRAVQNFGYNFRLQYNLHIINTTVAGDPEADLMRLVVAASLWTRTPDASDTAAGRGLTAYVDVNGQAVWHFEPERNELQVGEYGRQVPLQKIYKELPADFFHAYKLPLPLIFCRFYNVTQPAGGYVAP